MLLEPYEGVNQFIFKIELKLEMGSISLFIKKVPSSLGTFSIILFYIYIYIVQLLKI